MALPEKRDEAEKLYVREGLSCAEIAQRLQVNEGTVYRWKTEAAEKGEALDWDVQRRVYNLSPKEMVGLYSEAVKGFLLKLNSNPEILADPKIADAMSKHIAVLKKLDARNQYLGAITDLIKIASRYLAENDPELKDAMSKHWDGIFRELSNYMTKEGIF